MVKILTQDKFNESIKDGVAVIDVFATWCMPCKMFAPIFNDVASKLEQVKFYKLDVDENQQLAAELGILGVPTIMVFKDGVLVERFSGVRKSDELVELIRKNI